MQVSSTSWAPKSPQTTAYPIHMKYPNDISFYCRKETYNQTMGFPLLEFIAWLPGYKMYMFIGKATALLP
uniref:Uncharacterized protein n=1 Tax=Arundo donax TaxID=35708 RepID=A0A0A8Z5L3_ARUDO